MKLNTDNMWYPIPFSPLGPHRTETVGGSAFSPVTPAGAKCLLIQALAQNVRFTLDGTTPSATVGFQLKSTDEPILIVLTEGVYPQFFRETNGAILQYCYGK